MLSAKMSLSSSNNSFTAESCTICYQKSDQYKVLSCGHEFCLNCVRKIALEPNSKYPQTSETSAKLDCPNCRQMSVVSMAPNTISPSLKPKLLYCYQCDEDKSVGEFRWCHECLMSVCAKCLVEFHTELMSNCGSNRLHKSSRWESLDGVKFYAKQLKSLLKSTEISASETKEIAEVYCDGLKSHLNSLIKEKTVKSTSRILEEIDKLSTAFGVDFRQFDADGTELNETKLACFNQDLLKLNVVNSQPMELITNFEFQTTPYEVISSQLLRSDPLNNQETWVNPTRFSNAFNKAKVIGMQIIVEPIDLCMVDNRLLVISDKSRGLWYCDTIDSPEELLPVPLDQFKQSGFIAEISGESGFLANVYQEKLSHWKMIYLHKETNGFVLYPNDSVQLDLPINDNLRLATFSRCLCVLTPECLYKLDDGNNNQSNTASWESIYQLTTANWLDFGPIYETENPEEFQIFLINQSWMAVDILSYNTGESRVVGVIRMDLRSLVSPQILQLKKPFISGYWGGFRNGCCIIGDTKSPQLLLWFVRKNLCQKLAVLAGTTNPIKLMMIDKHIYAIVQNDAQFKAVYSYEL